MTLPANEPLTTDPSTSSASKMSPDFRRDALMTMARIIDLAALSVSFVVSFAISSGTSSWPDLADVLVMRIRVVNLVLFVAYLALCSAVFLACGLYRSHRLSHWRQRLYEIALAVSLITVAFLVLKQLFYIDFAIKAFLPLFWSFTLCALLLSHELALRLLQVARERGRNMRNVVIVGEGPEMLALANRVRQEATLGYCILRIIDAREVQEDGRAVGDISA
jgi:FlaA1/EpsC-like NDP-sugar epimerase